MKRTIVPVIMALVLLTGSGTAHALHSDTKKEQTLMKNMQMKIQHMRELMGILSDRLPEGMPEEQRDEMAGIMEELSQGMDELADIIRAGKVTEEQLERLNERLLELRMRLDRLLKPSASAT